MIAKNKLNGDFLFDFKEVDLFSVISNIKDSGINSKIFKSEMDDKLVVVNDTINPVGAFKVRGALNAIFSLISKEPKLKGICLASSGSFGMACSYACSYFDVDAYIFVPVGAPLYKIEKIKSLGGNVIVSGDSYEESKSNAIVFAKENKLIFQDGVDREVFSGNATLALEVNNFINENNMENSKIAFLLPLGIGSLLVPFCSFFRATDLSFISIAVEPSSYSKLSYLNDGINLTLEKTLADGACVSKFPDFSEKYIISLVDYYYSANDYEIKCAQDILNNSYGVQSEGAGALSMSCYLHSRDFFDDFDFVFVFVSGSNLS
ncbi:threonine dehydratase [Marinospirillum celere]|uniref:Threonine dehydratase n=1 Tax=Marinospirillum celere TaxID=1122252 RepID=A0A1I1EE92_9GAMM|nr:pyridoxal-phosphate dependent enzyme [Marinospirillum celere]SFB83648.1 threonine dehydratase [Marinospirillum celere]